MSQLHNSLNNFQKQAFIELAIEAQVLKFGHFILKSGRESPYFFNAGLFYHGETLRQVGRFYANLLIENNIEFQHLFGPAYKGLPLATATAVALAERGCNRTVTFNRKETKDHGEGGELIGAPLVGNTVMIDDVISAGTSFRESQRLINQYGGKLTTVVIALDRCERGLNTQSTLEDIKAQGINVLSIITLYDLIDYLENNHRHQELLQLHEYRLQYGV